MAQQSHLREAGLRFPRYSRVGCLCGHPTGHSSPSLSELWPRLETLQNDLWPPVALTTHDLRYQECSARRHLVLITHARLRAPQPGICVPSGWEIDLGSSEALAGGCEEGTSEPMWDLGQGRQPYSGAMAPVRMLWPGGQLDGPQMLRMISNSLPWQITRCFFLRDLGYVEAGSLGLSGQHWT